MKSFLSLILVSAAVLAGAPAYGGSVTGTLQGPSGLPIKNGTLSFALEQAGLIVGTGSVVPLTANCYTSVDGSVVGLPNPPANVNSAISYGSGGLPGGVYYVEITFYSGSQESLPSPEARVQLTGSGALTISPPVSFPPNAAGMRVYIGTASNTETLQGETASGTAAYSQAAALISGANPPASNSSVCSIAFNDTIIPYTGYNVSLLSSSGNSYPGWPQAWQLNGGANGVVNISDGAPLWNGVVVYPQPIVAQPLNHGPQSIGGALNLSGYNLEGVGSIGVGTNTPSWPIDVENGPVNASGGYLFNGGAGVQGQCLVSNGSAFVPNACFTPGAVFYQTVRSNATAQPQEPALNFSSAFSATDTPATQTTIDIAPTGVIAGSYSNPNMTLNAQGQVIAASNGPMVHQTETLIITSGICTTGSSASATCTMSPVSWPVAFADTNYSATCTPSAPSTGLQANIYVTKTAGTVTITLQNGQGSAAVDTTVGEIDCFGIHS